MTEKELKRASRSELLEMLITQMEENKLLKEKVESLQSQLDERTVNLGYAGSIAEASLVLNGVFEAAQNAAQHYLDNVKRITERQDLICENMYAQARVKADAMIAEAEVYSKKMHEDADAYSQRVHEKVQELFKDRENLRQLMQTAGRKVIT